MPLIKDIPAGYNPVLPDEVFFEHLANRQRLRLAPRLVRLSRDGPTEEHDKRQIGPDIRPEPIPVGKRVVAYRGISDDDLLVRGHEAIPGESTRNFTTRRSRCA